MCVMEKMFQCYQSCFGALIVVSFFFVESFLVSRLSSLMLHASPLAPAAADPTYSSRRSCTTSLLFLASRDIRHYSSKSSKAIIKEIIMRGHKYIVTYCSYYSYSHACFDIIK